MRILSPSIHSDGIQKGGSQMTNTDFSLRVNDGPVLVDERTAAARCGFKLAHFQALRRRGFLREGIPMPAPEFVLGRRLYSVETLTVWLAQFGDAGPRRRRRLRGSGKSQKAGALLMRVVKAMSVVTGEDIPGTPPTDWSNDAQIDAWLSSIPVRIRQALDIADEAGQGGTTIQ
jgi:hypothetical protein